MTTGAARALALLLILAAPLGEGGRLPGALAALHAAALALILLAGFETLSRAGAGRPCGRGIGFLLLPVAALLLACLSAARAAYPYAAWLGMMDRVAFVGALLGGALLLRTAADLALLRSATVVATTLQALYAFYGWWGGGPAGAAAVFLNRNHLAAYLNLGLFLCAAAAAGQHARGRRRAMVVWCCIGGVHLLAALLLQSRGGLAGLATGGAVLMVLMWRRFSTRARAACLLILLVTVAAGGGLVSLRFAHSADPDRYARLWIWKAGLAMVRERPLLGLGPGGFPHEAPRFNFPRHADPVRFGRSFNGAHSAVLTHAAEDGLPAALLVLSGALGSMALLWRRPGDGWAAETTQGMALAISALLAQSLVEDLQQRPALMVTAALLLGSSLAASRGWRPVTRPAARRPLITAALLLAGLYVAVAGIARPLLAWRSAQAARAAGRTGLPAMRRAALLDPWNAEYHHDLAMAALNSSPPGLEPYAEAVEQLQQARLLKRRDPRFPLLLARLESRAGRLIFDDPTRDAAAAALYAESARLAPTDPRPHLERAGHLADLGRVKEAVEVLEGALAIEPYYRRARILNTTLLLRIGRDREADASYAELLATDRELLAYEPDSGYASEIVADVPAARAALEAARGGVAAPAADATTR